MLDAIYQEHNAFHLALLRPATSPWDERILTVLWRAAERHLRIGFGALDPNPDEHDRRAHAHTDLISSFRSRDPEAASAAIRAHLERNEMLATVALERMAAAKGQQTVTKPIQNEEAHLRNPSPES